MNKIHKVIWCDATQTWVAVSELAKARGKSNTRNGQSILSALFSLKALSAAVLLALSGQVLAQQSTEPEPCKPDGSNLFCGLNAKVMPQYPSTPSTNVGGSVALGSGATVHSSSSVALGLRAQVGDNTSTAPNTPVGNDNNHNNSVAIGLSSKVTGWNSTASGSYSTVTEHSGSAYGTNSQVRAINGSAFGTSANVGTEAKGGIAVGFSAQSVGAQSIAIGSADESLSAIGNKKTGSSNVTTASGAQAIAIGAGSQAKSEDSIAIGRSVTVESTATSSIAIGSDVDVKDSASSSIAIGSELEVTSPNSIVLGSKAVGNSRAVVIGVEAETKATESNVIGYQAQSATNHSNAIGAFAKVEIGSGSNAIGYNAHTKGSYANAIGFWAEATQDATAIGNNAKASGYDSVAISHKSKAYGQGSVAIGQLSQAGKKNDISVGTNEQRIDAIAIGTVAEAKGKTSIAVGNLAKADLKNSIAIGTGAQTTQENAVALGASSKATRAVGSTYAGYDPTTGIQSTDTSSTWLANLAAVSVGDTGNTRQIINVAAGSADTDAVNVAQLKAAQTHYYSVNPTNSVRAYNSTNTSNKTNDGALGAQSLAAGQDAKAYSARSVAVGLRAQAGKDKPSLGQKQKQLGNVAFGVDSKAYGVSSSAFGTAAHASGTNSVAFGNKAEALSTTEWSETNNKVGYTTAIGGVSKAKADYATAIGYDADAEGFNSTAIGSYAYAKAPGSIAIGGGYKSRANAAQATLNNAIAIGLKAKSNVMQGIALGVNSEVTATARDGIALGSDSVADRLSGTAGYVPAGVTGAEKTAIQKTTQGTLGVVSVGNASNTRQIINLAAGTKDTDAVNVAQLKAASQGWDIGDSKNHNEEAVDTVHSGNRVDFVSDNDFATVVVKKSGIDGKNTLVKLAVQADGTLPVTADGKIGTVTNGLVTANTVADAINKTGFKLGIAAATDGSMSGASANQLIKPGDKVTIQAGKNLEVRQSGGAVTLAAKNLVAYDDNSQNKVTLNKSAVATQDAGTKRITVTGGTAITNLASAGDYTKVSNASKAVNAGDLNNAVLDVIGKGFNVNADTQSGSVDKPVTHKLGKELAIVANNTIQPSEASTANLSTDVHQDATTGKTTVTVKMAKAPTFSGTVTMNGGMSVKAGETIDMGNNPIINVGPGDKNHHAVNVEQLKKVISDAISQTQTTVNADSPFSYIGEIGKETKQLVRRLEDGKVVFYTPEQIDNAGNPKKGEKPVTAENIRISALNPTVAQLSTAAKVTNVANGEISAKSRDAINGSQLNKVMVDGIKVGANAGVSGTSSPAIHALGKQLDILGGTTLNVDSSETKNLFTTVAQNNTTGKTTVTVRMAKSPSFSSIKLGDTANPVSSSNPIVNIGGGNITGLTNTDWSLNYSPSSGRAATEEQLAKAQTHYYSVKSTNEGPGSNYLNKGATGTNALAAGVRVKAEGWRSVAIGSSSEAKALRSIAIGSSSKALNQNSVAIGSSSEAKGVQSIVIGTGVKTAQKQSIAIGGKMRKNQEDIATEVLGQQSVAIGVGAKALEEQTVALGFGAKAKGEQSTALGNDTHAAGNSSIAIGGNDLDKVASKIPPAWDAKQKTSEEANELNNTVAAIAYKALTGDILVHYENPRNESLDTSPSKENKPYRYTSTKAEAGAVAVGVSSTAGDLATSFGTRANAYSTASLALGVGSQAGIINDSKKHEEAKGLGAIAIGAAAKATGKQSIAVGVGNVVSGDHSGTFGDPSINAGAASYTFGNDNAVGSMSKDVFVFGSNNQVGARVNTYKNGKIVTKGGLTDTTHVLGSSAVGNHNYINSSGTYILGSHINVKDDDKTPAGSTVGNSVYLGDYSTAKAGVGAVNSTTEKGTLFNLTKAYEDGATTTAGHAGEVNSATVGGIEYKTFAGAEAKGVVSVGYAGGERRIQNVAAGEISATSTDAIQGSQLYAVAKTLTNTGFDVGANTLPEVGGIATAPTHKLGNQLDIVAAGKDTNYKGDYKSDNLTTKVEQYANGKTMVTISMKDSPKFGEVTINDVGDQWGTKATDKGNTITGLANDTLNVEGFATKGRAATEEQLDKVRKEAQEAVSSSSWKIAGANKQAVGDGVHSDEQVNFINGNVTTATVAQDGTSNNYNVSYDVNTDGTTLTTKPIDANDPSKGKQLTVVTTGFTLNDGTDSTKPKGTVTAGNDTALATAGDIATAINNSGFTVKANGDKGEFIQSGGSVDLVAGDHMKITRSGSTFTFATDNQAIAESAHLPVVYTNADGDKLYRQSDGTFNTKKDGKGATVANDKVVTSMQGADGSTTNPTTLTNVASNLDGAKTGTTAPTTSATKPADLKNSNAATVGDVLNAGWNLKVGETAADFVTAYDTVKFDSSNQSVTISEAAGSNDNATTIDFAVNADNQTIEVGAGGVVKAKTSGITTTGGVATATDSKALATAGDIATAINNAGFTLTTTASDGKVAGSSNASINAGKTVTIDAGNNVAITQSGSQVSIAVSDQPEFDNVTINKGLTVANGATVDMGNNKITNLGEGEIAPGSKDSVTGGQVFALTGGKPSNTTTFTDPTSGVAHDVVVDENGKRLLTTYNVKGQSEYVTNSVVTAISNMNEQGIRFFHTNDGKVKPEAQEKNTVDSSASGQFATAVGYQAKAGGENALAIGKGARALGTNSISIGTGNEVNATNSGAIGDPSYIGPDSANPGTGAVDGSYSIGNNNTIHSSKTFVLGNEVTVAAGNDGAVVLGDKSTIEAVQDNQPLTLGGARDAQVAGKRGVGTQVVSVGSKGNERRIQNVAPGRVTLDSTDAINGSQLYLVEQRVDGVNSRVDGLDARVDGVAQDVVAVANYAQAVEQKAVKYETNPDGSVNYNKVRLEGAPYDPRTGKGGTTIQNVAAGTKPSDAVNVAQLSGVRQELIGAINHVDNRARGGIASAMASAGLPQAYLPGKSMVAAGVAHYRGESALAVGVSSISDNGKWVIKGTANVNANDAGVSVGVGYQW